MYFKKTLAIPSAPAKASKNNLQSPKNSEDMSCTTSLDLVTAVLAECLVSLVELDHPKFRGEHSKQ